MVPHARLRLLYEPAMAQATGLFTCCLTMGKSFTIPVWSSYCGNAVTQEYIGPKVEKKGEGKEEGKVTFPKP